MQLFFVFKFWLFFCAHLHPPRPHFQPSRHFQKKIFMNRHDFSLTIFLISFLLLLLGTFQWSWILIFRSFFTRFPIKLTKYLFMFFSYSHSNENFHHWAMMHTHIHFNTFSFVLRMLIFALTGYAFAMRNKNTENYAKKTNKLLWISGKLDVTTTK